MSDIFEDFVFEELKKGFRKKNHNAFMRVTSFDQRVAENFLVLENLKNKDPQAVIKRMVSARYNINLTQPHLALSMKQVIAFDNSNIELMFSDEFMDFEPDEELIMKSKVPLWVIKPMGGGRRVHIQRMW